MTRALICHGPGIYQVIELDDATTEQVEVAIVSQLELEMVEALTRLQETKHELD